MRSGRRIKAGCQISKQVAVGKPALTSSSGVPTARNRICKSVHASLMGLERMGREQAGLDRPHHPAARCAPKRIAVTSATKPLRAAPPRSVNEHLVAPEAVFARTGQWASFEQSGVAASIVPCNIDAEAIAVALQNAPSLAAWIDGITDLDSGNFARATRRRMLFSPRSHIELRASRKTPFNCSPHRPGF
jgi:hypothetical protein